MLPIVWRGLVSLWSGDDLTHAASVPYCSLFSLFPIFLLAFAVFGAVAAREANRAAVVDFILRYFPARSEFVSRQLDALATARAQVAAGQRTESRAGTGDGVSGGVG
jgi:uncharacterized BrkB/YihY/UPF0761 family membrane protein